jgi:ATP-dependent Zn protease
MNGGNDLFGEKFKLEIKTAKDITQRLSDVKGVDEIKHEVEDLIKMLKNPE